MSGKKFLVTGAAGYLGSLVVPALLAARDCEVIGLDRQAPAQDYGPRYTHLQLDLTRADSHELASALAGVDCLIHLAFQMAPRPGEDLHGINVAAQERFLNAATGVRRWLIASAAAAYGFPGGRDPVHGVVSESTPLTPGPGVAYAEHKQALERLLDRLEAAHEVEVVRARPTNVAGPGIDPRRAPQLAGPVMLAPATSHPLRQQLLHEEDLASAFVALLDAPPGCYNVAPDDWLTLEQAARLLGQRYVALPGWVLRPLVDLAWRGGQSLFDASWLAFLEHPPIILSNSKLREQGWAPRHTTHATLLAVAQKLRAR